MTTDDPDVRMWAETNRITGAATAARRTRIRRNLDVPVRDASVAFLPDLIRPLSKA